MGERVLTVLEEIEHLTVYGVDPAVVERIEEKYRAERQKEYDLQYKKERELYNSVVEKDTLIKVLVDYIQSKGL